LFALGLVVSGVCTPQGCIFYFHPHRLFAEFRFFSPFFRSFFFCVVSQIVHSALHPAHGLTVCSLLANKTCIAFDSSHQPGIFSLSLFFFHDVAVVFQFAGGVLFNHVLFFLLSTLNPRSGPLSCSSLPPFCCFFFLEITTQMIRESSRLTGRQNPRRITQTHPFFFFCFPVKCPSCPRRILRLRWRNPGIDRCLPGFACPRR